MRHVVQVEIIRENIAIIKRYIDEKMFIQWIIFAVVISNLIITVDDRYGRKTEDELKSVNSAVKKIETDESVKIKAELDDGLIDLRAFDIINVRNKGKKVCVYYRKLGGTEGIEQYYTRCRVVNNKRK